MKKTTSIYNTLFGIKKEDLISALAEGRNLKQSRKEIAETQRWENFPPFLKIDFPTPQAWIEYKTRNRL